VLIGLERASPEKKSSHPELRSILQSAMIAGPEAAHPERDAQSELAAHLDELAELAATCGFDGRLRLTQKRTHPDPALYLGRGKVDELAQVLREEKIKWVFCDDDLSPSQQANLEKALSVRVLDRSGLILEIFARRARSREAKTQVELARMEYLLPRLKHQWQHLERQTGGIGARAGMGETQLEIDRRIVRGKISALRRDLARITTQRALRRRARRGLPQVAIVGYTNAGKSTLMTSLSGAQTFVEDRLFATLDPLVRRVHAGGHPYLLIDTVGFIRKLPHDLVASFKSTLEETSSADLLIHLIDAADPDSEAHTVVALDVLSALGLHETPRLTVYNKVDKLTPERRENLMNLDPDALHISALERRQPALEKAIAAILYPAPRITLAEDDPASVPPADELHSTESSAHLIN
jgi:GTP-binding protein HflX